MAEIKVSTRRVKDILKKRKASLEDDLWLYRPAAKARGKRA